MKTELRDFVEKKNVYIANDGTEFASKHTCLEHEANLYLAEKLKDVNKLLVYKDGMVPCNGALDDIRHIFNWYRFETREQAEKIADTFDISVDVSEIPGYVSIELSDPDESEGYSASSLSVCKEHVKTLFDEFGIDVEFNIRHKYLSKHQDYIMLLKSYTPTQMQKFERLVYNYEEVEPSDAEIFKIPDNANIIALYKGDISIEEFLKILPGKKEPNNG